MASTQHDHLHDSITVHLFGGHQIPGALCKDHEMSSACQIQGFNPASFQTTPHGSKSVSDTTCRVLILHLDFKLNDCIWKAYLQIWLFEMRHFPEMVGISPRKDDGKPKPAVQRPDDNLWHRIAKLALKGNFDSAAIRQYIGRDPDVKMASEFLRQCRPTEHYNFDETVFSSEVQRIATTLRAVQARGTTSTAPLLSFNGQGNMSLADRCGRPFEQSFLDDKKYLFISYIYNTHWASLSLEQLTSLRQRHLTSFMVKRDIFHAFFGNSLESAPAQQTFESISPSDQMICEESTDGENAREMTEPPSNQALPSMTYQSATSTAAHHTSNHAQLPMETINIPQNNMQLALPEPQESLNMVDAQLLPETTSITVLEPLEKPTEKTIALPRPADISAITGIHSTSDTMHVDVPETSECLQITNAPHEDSEAASPDQTLPGSFPITTVQRQEKSETPSTNIQHPVSAVKRVWPRERTVRELMNHHASSVDTLTPLLLYNIETREYEYCPAGWREFSALYMKYKEQGIHLKFMSLDQTEQLNYERIESCYEAAMKPPPTRFMFGEVWNSHSPKNPQRRHLADLDSPVSQRVRAIEDLGKYQGASFTNFRG